MHILRHSYHLYPLSIDDNLLSVPFQYFTTKYKLRTFVKCRLASKLQIETVPRENFAVRFSKQGEYVCPISMNK